MKKILITAGVSVLSTLALGSGVLAVLTGLPSTKDKLKLSWEQTDIFGKNQENIASLEKELSDKDKQIKGQQVTIEKLNQLLAGPEKYNIELPEDVQFSEGVVLLNANEDVVLFSSYSNTGTSGLWMYNKIEKSLKQITNLSYRYYNLIKISNGRYLVLGSSHFIVLDENFEVISDQSSTMSVSSGYEVKEYANYVIFGSSSSSGIYIFDKNSNTFKNFSSCKILYSLVKDNLLLSVVSSKLYIYDIVNETSENVTVSSNSQIFDIDNKIYLMSKSVLSTFDIDTKEVTTIQESLGLSNLPDSLVKVRDNLYLTTSSVNSSVSVCVLDTANDNLIYFSNGYVKDVFVPFESDNYYVVMTTTGLYFVDLEEFKVTGINSDVINNYIVMDGYLVYNTKTNFKVFEIETQNEKLSIYMSGFNVKSYNKLDDNKYELIAEEGIGILNISDTGNSTFVMTNIII